MRKFKTGDIVSFGYGSRTLKGGYSAYRTILLLEQKDNIHWRGALINDTAGYYEDHQHYRIAPNDAKLVWRQP